MLDRSIDGVPRLCQSYEAPRRQFMPIQNAEPPRNANTWRQECSAIHANTCGKAAMVPPSGRSRESDRKPYLSLFRSQPRLPFDTPSILESNQSGSQSQNGLFGTLKRYLRSSRPRWITGKHGLPCCMSRRHTSTAPLGRSPVPQLYGLCLRNDV